MMEYNRLNHKYMSYLKGYAFTPKTGEARFICNDGSLIVAKDPEEAERKITEWIAKKR